MTDNQPTATIKCMNCNGTGVLEAEVDVTPTKYGKHTIPNEWSKITNVYIWFQALRHKKVGWNGIPGYVYETPAGEYYAPFRGELVKVIKDTRNEFTEEE